MGDLVGQLACGGRGGRVRRKVVDACVMAALSALRLGAFDQKFRVLNLDFFTCTPHQSSLNCPSKLERIIASFDTPQRNLNSSDGATIHHGDRFPSTRFTHTRLYLRRTSGNASLHLPLRLHPATLRHHHSALLVTPPRCLEPRHHAARPRLHPASTDTAARGRRRRPPLRAPATRAARP